MIEGIDQKLFSSWPCPTGPAPMACGVSAAEPVWKLILKLMEGAACGAALVPLSQSVLFDIYPAERRGSAMAIWGVGVQLGPILGPILGGWLTEDLSWRWVFYVNVPFGILTSIGLLVFLKDTPRSRSTRFDWIGFGALSIAIGSLQLMLDQGEELDWFSSPEIIIETCLAGVGFYSDSQ